MEPPSLVKMGTSASQYTCGYRVLDVQPNSPGLQAGLVSFFDFIMKAEDQTFETEGEDLVNLLTRHKNQKLALVVYNTKSRTYREVSIIPSDTWGGDGSCLQIHMMKVELGFESHVCCAAV